MIPRATPLSQTLTAMAIALGLSLLAVVARADQADTDQEMRLKLDPQVGVPWGVQDMGTHWLYSGKPKNVLVCASDGNAFSVTLSWRVQEGDFVNSDLASGGCAQVRGIDVRLTSVNPGLKKGYFRILQKPNSDQEP